MKKIQILILLGLLHIANTACQINQYQSGSSCYNCSLLCNGCTVSATNCTACANLAIQGSPPTCACISGYYLSASKCYACVKPCITCTSSTTCTSCMDTVNQTLPNCKCASNQYQDTTTKKCYNCTSPCASCSLNSSTNCLTCVDGYLSFSQKCLPCTLPCATCLSYQSYCMSCIDPVQINTNYSCSCPSTKYLDTTTYYCQNCVSPCLNCSSATKCTSCIDQYILSGSSCLACTKPCDKCSSTVTTCTSCIDTKNQITPACSCSVKTKYLDPQTYMCLDCISPCYTCTSSTSCSSCIDTTYTLIGSNCVQCSSPCKTCSNIDSSCTSCVDPYNQTPPYCLCTNKGYYLDKISFMCLDCKTPCATCLSSSYCTQCVSDSYSLLNYVCVECSKPCLTCGESVTQCTSCIDQKNQSTPDCLCQSSQYMDTNTYTCLDCISPCAVCKSDTICTQCLSTKFTLIDNTCVKCQPPCLECQGSANQCTSCIDQQNQQIPDCQCKDSSQYLDNNTYFCFSCMSGCVSCTSANFCTKCINDQYILIDNVCVICQPPCLQCKGSVTECTSCIDKDNQQVPDCKCSNENQYLDINTYTCSKCSSSCISCTSADICNKCIDDRYILIDNACVKCQSPCQKCFGSTSQCTTCVDQDNQQLPDCLCRNSNQYLDIDTQTCLDCVSPCISCTSTKYCTSCIENKYILIDNTCIKCQPPCLECSESITQCTSCIDQNNQKAPDCQCLNMNQYLDNDTQTCLDCVSPCNLCTSAKYCTSCIDNTYLLIDNSCVKCSSPCLECSESITNCTSCIDKDTQKLPDCKCINQNQYFNSDTNTCESCISPCLTCASENYCTKCINDTYLLIDNFCVQCTEPCSECSDIVTNCTSCIDVTNQKIPSCQCLLSTQYLDKTDFYCYDCQTPCYNCQSARQCTSCISDGYILVDYSCLSCKKPCKTCAGSVDQCTSCIDEINQKTPNCQCTKENQFLDSTTFTCQNCLYPCLTCSKKQNNCISCIDQVYQSPPNCECLAGYYMDMKTFYCFQCTFPCKTCQNKTDECLTCASTYKFNSKSFTCQCDITQFEQKQENPPTCQDCQSPCLSCSNQSTNCESCQDGLNRHLYQNTCICNDGFYEKDSICIQCQLPCVNCLSQTECSLCQNEQQELPNCLCKQTYYMDQQNNCQQCHYSCLECEQNYKKCIKCQLTYQFNNNQCICQNGYFEDVQYLIIDQQNKHFCNKCQLPCTNCQNTANQCTSCLDLNHILINNVCICKQGYGQSNGFNCAKCEQPCLECSMNTTTCTSCINSTFILQSTQCICKLGYYNYENDCKQCFANCGICEGDNSCTQCLDGYYLEVNQCKECSNQCKICNSISDCVSCFEGFYFDNIQCTPCISGCSQCNDTQTCAVCLEGYYLQDNYCQKCDNKCKSCIAQSSCTSCYTDSDLRQDQCQCKDGYFEQDSQCFKCQLPCFSCKNESVCLKCASIANLSFDNGSCLCNDGFFWNESNCEQCDKSCLTCSGNSKKCLRCDTKGYKVLNNNRCVCQNDYFEDKNKLCIPCKSEQGKLEQSCKIKDSSDNVWTYGEQCDDGNDIPRDGCSKNTIDYNYSCTNVILQKSVCFNCPDNCKKCIQIDQITCTNCETGYYLLEKECSICPNKCLGCQETGICNSCRFLKEKGQCQVCEYKTGYYSNYETNQCYTVCGDSHVADGQEECDDGNRSNGDGCDSNCKLEKKFVCQDGVCIQPYPTPVITQTGKAPLFSNTRSFNLTYNLDLKSISGFDLKSLLSVYIVSQNDNFRLLQAGELTSEQTQQQPFKLDYQIHQNEDGQYTVSATLTIQLKKSSQGEELLIKLKASDKVCSSLGYCQQDIETKFPIQKYIQIDQQTFGFVDSVIAICQSMIVILVIFGIITLFFGDIKIFFNLLDVLQLLSYLEYINIQYPYNLEAIFNFLGFAKFNQILHLCSFNYALYFSDPWTELLPQKIQPDGYNSLLLINCISFLLLWMIIIGLYFLSRLAPLILNKLIIKSDSSDNKIQVTLKIYLLDLKMFVNKTFLYFRQHFFYNIILRTHISTSFDCCFLMILQLFTYQIRSSSPRASFSSFLFIVTFIIYLGLIFLFTIMSDRKDYEINTLKAKRTYGTIFQLVDGQKYKKFYSTIVLIKKLIFIFLLIYCYPNPIFQILSLFCLMILSSLLTLVLKPFENPIEYQKQLSSDIIISFLFGLVFLLALDQEVQLNLNDEAVGWCCTTVVIIILLIQLFCNTHQLWDQLLGKYKIMRKIAFYLNQLFFSNQVVQTISPNVLTEVEF